MKIMLASPRGFCAGVERAIEIVTRALKIYGAPVYVRHEVVHNKTVVADLREQGAVFVQEVEDVPRNGLVIFSAHGVSREVKRRAEERNLRVFDATCPLVTKVHLEVAKAAREGRDTILIGHAGHPEVEGTLGQYDREDGRAAVGRATNGRVADIHLVEKVADVEQLSLGDPDRVSYVTQTTLSVDDASAIIASLRQRYPDVVGPSKNDICYATQNRQDAVKKLAQASDLILVVGSANSSNSNRLREIAERLGTASFLIDDESEIRPEWLVGSKVIGVTSGASAPETLVSGVIEHLRAAGGEFLGEQGGVSEDMTFSLPQELRNHDSLRHNQR